MAIPSSGNISIKSAAGSGRSIDAEQSGVSSGSLVTLSTSGVVTSGNTIDGATPHAMSEFYGYTHTLPDFTWTVVQPTATNQLGRQAATTATYPSGISGAITGTSMFMSTLRYGFGGGGNANLSTYTRGLIKFRFNGTTVEVYIMDAYNQWSGTSQERFYYPNAASGNPNSGYFSPSENTYYKIMQYTLGSTPTHYKITRSAVSDTEWFPQNGNVSFTIDYDTYQYAMTTGSWVAYPGSDSSVDNRANVEVDGSNLWEDFASAETVVSYKLEIRDASNNSDTHVSTHDLSLFSSIAHLGN